MQGEVVGVIATEAAVSKSIFGRSGMSDERLAELWAELQKLYPDACNRLDNPPPNEGEEEGKASTSFIQLFLDLHRPEIPGWPDKHYVYLDLLDFHGRRRLAQIIAKASLDSPSEYWTVRNSLSCHPERFKGPQRDQMVALMRLYEKRSPGLA